MINATFHPIFLFAPYSHRKFNGHNTAPSNCSSLVSAQAAFISAVCDGRWPVLAQQHTTVTQERSTLQNTMSDLSPRVKALSIIPHFTGALSVVGSVSIAYRVLSDSKRRTKTYQRILLATSLCDAISSFCYFLSTWPIPQGVNDGWNDPYYFQAFGNEATCTAQGVGIQFGVVTAFYSVALSLHYLLVVRYRFTDEYIKNKIEPLMLGIPFVLALALTIPGIFLKMYNNSNLW